MRSTKPHLAWVLALAACGDAPETATASESAPPPLAPVPLGQALDGGLAALEGIRRADGESNELRLVLRPLVRTRPPVTVEAGAVFAGGEALWVAALPVTETLYATANKSIDVPVVSLDPHARRPREFRLEATSGGGPVGWLLETAAEQDEPPGWAALQVATWVAAADVDYATLRDATFTDNVKRGVAVFMGERADVVPTVAVIDEARTLLRRAAYPIEDARLFRGTEDAMDAALRDLSDPTRELQALYALDFFRSRPEVEAAALRVLDEAGSEHSREAAARLLGHRVLDLRDDGAARRLVLDRLREARAREDDAGVLAAIDRALAWGDRT